MSRTETAPITGAVLRWAMREAGYDTPSLARKLHVEPASIDAWLRDESDPRVGDFRRLAEVLRRPSAVFFLPSPPETHSVAAAFREAPGTEGRDELTPAEALEMRRARRRQQLASAMLRDAGEGEVRIPPQSLERSAEQAAHALRTWIGLSMKEQFAWTSDAEALQAWRAAFERAGLLLFMASLGEGAIRGFSLPDDYAPLVLANTTGYGPPARVFTWWHEAAHLSLGERGVCGRYFFEVGPKVERWCERVAAAAILPRAAVLRSVREKYGYRPGQRMAGWEEARWVRDTFNASLTATIIRLINLDVAPHHLYEQISQHKSKRRSGGGGGETRAESRLREVGDRYASVVVEGWTEGHLPAHEALDFLDIRPGDLSRLETLLMSESG